MQTDGLKTRELWYYLEESGGWKLDQWFQVSGKHYYVDASGALAVNTIIDGYRLERWWGKDRKCFLNIIQAFFLFIKF